MPGPAGRRRHAAAALPARLGCSSAAQACTIGLAQRVAAMTALLSWLRTVVAAVTVRAARGGRRRGHLAPLLLLLLSTIVALALAWQLRLKKWRAEYQRSLLLDKPELFRGVTHTAAGGRHDASAALLRRPRPWNGGGKPQHAVADVARSSHARFDRLDAELRLAMDPRWFRGAGERVVDRSPPRSLLAAIARPYAQAAAAQAQLFVWFIGDTDSTTGASWCPDCNRARPFLAPRLAELPASAVVLEVAVSREEWRSQSHPYRQPPVRIHA